MTTFLIDDDPLSNYLTETLLRIEQFPLPIRTFISAEEGLQAVLSTLKADSCAVVLLDLNMPIMNGWQFLDALLPYAARLRSQCHLYILTSSLALTDQAKAATYEFVDGLIHKPLDRAQIHAIHAQLQEDENMQ